jgi:hypothetical protein
MSGKDWERFIGTVKSMVRSSQEYRHFVSVCKIELGMTNCSFLHRVSSEEEGVDVEIHHAGLGLHEIVEIVAEDLIADGGVTSMTVADSVMAAHFDGLVMVCPLSKTAHELVHAGRLNVKVEQCHGDLAGLLRRHARGVRGDHLERIRTFLDLSLRPAHEPGLLDVADRTGGSSVASGLDVEEVAAIAEARVAAQRAEAREAKSEGKGRGRKKGNRRDE